MESGMPVGAIMMDFAKAFDRVNHSLLVHKLNCYGIRGNMNSWMANFLHDRKQTVVIDGAKSDYTCMSVVSQGSGLGSCHFLLYINDLPLRVSSPSQLFADDTILYHFIACAQDQYWYYSRTSSIWRSWNQSWTCHSTLTNAANSCS